MSKEYQEIKVPTHLIPEGAELVEAYRYKGEIIIIGEPDEATDHNCDQMGCTTLSHVLYRLKEVSDEQEG